MSKADIIRAYSLSKVGLPYQLGEEFDHNAGPTLTAREDGDCSGIVYAAFTEAQVLINGKRLERETANTYYQRAVVISNPSKVGDCCWFPRAGHKSHMAMFIGRGQVIEAGNHGPGGVYPGKGYVGLCTVAQMNNRGCVWGRFSGNDIGELSEEEDMPITKVPAKTAKEAEANLAKAKLIDSPGLRPYDAAVSWGLCLEMLERVAERAGLLK